jgi:hypothetical protein
MIERRFKQLSTPSIRLRGTGFHSAASATVIKCVLVNHEFILRFHLGNATRMTAHNWGLEIRRNPVDPAALLDVLGARFSYWNDDVEHRPIFD